MFFLLIPKLNHMDFSYCLKLQILMEATKNHNTQTQIYMELNICIGQLHE